MWVLKRCKLVKCPISKDFHMRPISTLGSPRFRQLPHRSDPPSNAHARVDAWRAMPMLAWTFASATGGNAHARMEPGRDPCLENAHARVEGAGSDAEHSERPWCGAMPMLVSILVRELVGGLGANLTLPTEGRTGPTPRRRKFREPKRQNLLRIS